MARTPLPDPLGSRAFTHAEGLASGLGKGRLAGRDLSRPFHGVKMPGVLPTNVMERCHAFAVRMPSGAFFNSATAALIMGAPLPLRLEHATELHVAVVAPVRALKSRGVIGHKVQLMGADTRAWNGLVISSPERMWCELAELLQLHELVAVGDYLIHWTAPMTSIAALQTAIERYPGRRGKSVARLALPLLHDRIESPKESELHVILVLAGFRGFEINYPIVIERRRYRADVAFPEYKFILEFQGDYHRDPVQWRADMTRIAKFETVEWYVMQINSDDLRKPTELVARIRAKLSHRGAPNPPS